MNRQKVLLEISVERDNQLEKWGEQHHPDGTSWDWKRPRDQYRELCDEAASIGMVTWRHIALEELYEALSEMNPARLRAELVQTAAVMVAWIEDIDSRTE